MKAVICAAGYGTRLFPATKTIPKEMLPILNKPCIDFLIEELIEAGIEKILIIHSRRKKALEDYFDREIELEHCITNPEKQDLIRPITEIKKIDIQFIRQKSMQGTGHALLLAKEYLKESAFILAYPDDIILHQPALTKELIKTHSSTNQAVIAALHYQESDISSYGVIHGARIKDKANLLKVDTITEKPQNPTSRYISIGRYLLTPAILTLLEKNYQKHTGGEFYLTSTLNEYAQDQTLHALESSQKHYDIGKASGYLEAITDYALQDPKYRSSYIKFLHSRLNTASPSK